MLVLIFSVLNWDVCHLQLLPQMSTSSTETLVELLFISCASVP